MPHLARGQALAIAIVGLAVLAPAGPAHGAAVDDPLGLGGRDLIPWPQALPPAAVPGDVQPGPVRHCRGGGVRCARALERRLRRQWRRFDARCDHRAPIAYSYLEITRELRRELERPGPGLVRHRRWMSYLITTFSNRYFDAFRAWRRGRPLAEAWRITFEVAQRSDAHAAQDVFLFSNAHVQHDLPFAYEETGIRTRSGRSRKPDHDAVNEVNARVFEAIERRIAARYDPTMGVLAVPVVPLQRIAPLELVKLWRESAWRSAERLLVAGSAAERRRVVATIEDSSASWARLISAVEIPGHRGTREQWCRAGAGGAAD